MVHADRLSASGPSPSFVDLLGDRTLARGDEGQAVRALQRFLNGRGARLPITGQLDGTTESAIRGLQRSLGLPASGQFSPDLLARAEKRLTTDRGDGFARTARSRETTQPRGNLGATPVDPARADALQREARSRIGDARAQTLAGPAAPLTIGAEGARVRRVERQLQRAGFDPGKVDGKYDAATARAVGRFQDAVGVAHSGDADQRTTNRLDAVNERIGRTHGKTVGPGERNHRTLQAEKRLARLGYAPGKIDGTYDRDTADAMKRFRADQGSKDPNGSMHQGTERALKREVAALAHDPEHRRTTGSAAQRRNDRITARAAGQRNADGTVGIGEGDRGKAVQHVQRQLRAAGYDPKHTDGRFDERTAGALKQFQRRSELPVTGRVDTRTWNKLQHATMEAKDGFSPPQRKGERSAAVRRTEQQLKKLGYDPGKIDGLYTDATQRAVDRFRQKAHLGGRGGGVGPRVHEAMKKALSHKAPRATFDHVTNAGALNQGVDGHLTINGHRYDFKSGFWGRGSLPPGKYKVGPFIDTNEAGMVRDGVGFKVGLSNKWDPRVGDTRSALFIHPDGNVPGTLGCIGLQGGAGKLRQFVRDIKAELRRSGGSFMMQVG